MSKQTESQPATRMSSLPWLLHQAKNHRGGYLQSVAFAACGVVCQIAPYFVVADILRRLVAGERDLGGLPQAVCRHGGAVGAAGRVPRHLHGLLPQGDLRRAGRDTLKRKIRFPGQQVQTASP